ncbi:mucin-5AC [Gadus chalcogrammus]|uniref:mucin-5AC n=1 Tax=Gadus chalcogrammus TaxID=1042646 RepID=UPI0024C48658|nr:mucin-5AC [Gadus chalcogrammus]
MSSSDAGKLGGRRRASESAESKHTGTSTGTTRSTSDQREETTCEGILREQHLGDKTEPSECQTETLYKEHRPGAVNVVHVTSFYCRLSAPPSTTPASVGGLPATRDTVPQPYPPSFHEALRNEPYSKSLQDHGNASPGASLEEFLGLKPSEKTSVLINNQEKAVPDYVSSTTTHTFFREIPEYDYDRGSLNTVPPVSKLNSTSVDSVEDRKSNWTELETPNQLVGCNKPNKAMLSSAMVSVLAPHWSRRNQRTKKGLSSEDFEAQNVAHGPNTGAQTVHNRFLEPHRHFRGERDLGDGPHVQDPLVGHRRKIDGWSSFSGPSSLNLNFTTKRLTPRTVSVDMDSRTLDNRDTVGCYTNPKEKTPLPIPSLSLDLRTNERISPGAHQRPLAKPSSKPTTSGFLLSLRKIGSTWKSPSMSETGSRSLTGPNRDRAAVSSNLNPSFTSPSNNSTQRWMPRPYSSHIPHGPNISQTDSLTSPTFSHPQKPISTNQPGPPEEFSTSDNNTDPARLTQYEQYTILKGQDLPRGTTLRSGTWWKQVTQEGGVQPGFKDTASIINNNRHETHTPLVTPCNRNSDLASLRPNDNRSLNRQIPNHAEHTKAEAISLGTHALVFNRPRGPETLRRSNAEDRSGLQSDTFSTQSKGFNLNEKQSQQPHSSLIEVNKVNVNKASANIINQNVYSLDKSHLTAHTQRALLTPSPVSSPTYMDCTISENTSPKILNENQSIHTNDTPTCREQKPASSQDASFQSTALPRCTYKRPTPLVFERTYPTISKHVHPKALFIYKATVSSKTNCKPLLTVPTSPPNPSSTPVPSTTSVLLTVPGKVPTATSPTPFIGTSFLLTPPVTPTPSCSPSPSPKSSLSKKESTFFKSQDISSSKKQSPKGRRRVTWQDSVDLQRSEDMGQASLPPTPSPPLKTSPSPLTRSPHSLESPSTFSFLRKGNSADVPRSSPVFLPIPKATSGKAESEERSQQTVSASPVSPMDWTSEHTGGLSPSPGPDKRSPDRANQWQSYVPLSLPPDFSYKQHYSSPPYSSLKSARSPQGEAENPLPTSPPGFQPQTFSPSSLSRPSALSPDPAANRTLTQSQRSPDPISPTQTVPLPFPNRPVLPEGLKYEGLRLKEADDKIRKQSYKTPSSSQEDNKAVMGSERLSLQTTLQDKTLPPSTACVSVVETLVYSLCKGNSTDSPGNNTPRSLIQCTGKTRFSIGKKPSIQLSPKTSGVGGNQYYPLNQNANTSSTKDTSFPLFTATDKSSTNSKGPTWRNESTSRPGDSLPANQETRFVPDKAAIEHASKGITQMDQGVSKLRRQFAGMLSDDLTRSPKGNQSSKTPSISGSSVGNNSNITMKSNDTLEGDKEMDIPGDTNAEELERRETEKDRWTKNRFTLVPKQGLCNRSSDHFSSSSHITPGINAQTKFLVSNHPFTEREAKEERASPRQMSLPIETQCRDPDLCKQSPGDSASTTLSASSNNRPRAPFARYSSSPISPYLTGTEIDDSVFYSPKEQTPPDERGRSVSPLGTARRKMSTSPSTEGPVQAKGRLASYSSCADLKYGIDAGRSISVSSVVSSRRQGSERISKGLRVLSVDDLSEPAGTSKYEGQSMGDQGSTSNYRLSSRPGEMRSKSLPRSLKSLSCWSSEDGPPKRQSPTTSPQDRPSGPRSRNTDLFQFYSEGGLTPPPSPASPASLLMCKPPRRSSPLSPAASRDSLSVRGMPPTRGMVASLSDFDESSDSSSDSTTDDEYYLESEEDDDKESSL